jgi:hypothetical protein
VPTDIITPGLISLFHRIDFLGITAKIYRSIRAIHAPVSFPPAGKVQKKSLPSPFSFASIFAAVSMETVEADFILLLPERLTESFRGGASLFFEGVLPRAVCCRRVECAGSAATIGSMGYVPHCQFISDVIGIISQIERAIKLAGGRYNR